MECSVCYCETGRFCKLLCGHTFCNACVKAWYRKSTEPTCPMCRRPMYFRGFQKVQAQWDEDSYDEKTSDVYGQMIDATTEQAFEMAETFPKWRRRIMKDLMDEIKEIESTYNFLKSRESSSDDIEYFLFETEDYFSDRHLDRCLWIDEPIKEFATRYPKRAGGTRGGKRARALEDEWATINFVIVM